MPHSSTIIFTVIWLKGFCSRRERKVVLIAFFMKSDIGDTSVNAFCAFIIAILRPKSKVAGGGRHLKSLTAIHARENRLKKRILT